MFGGSRVPHLSEAGKDSAQPSNTSSKNWELSLGPLSIGSRGVDLKPQLKVGFQNDNVKAEAGVGDIRDGLRLSAKAQTFVEATASGRSLAEVHENIRCETPGFREALHKAKTLLETPEVLRDLAEKLRIQERIISDRLKDCALRAGAGDRHVDLRVKASLGVGVDAQVCLGWCDTKGFKMVGVGGHAAAVLAVGANLFAGRHASGESFKVVLGIGNFSFDYTISMQSSASTEAACASAGSRDLDCVGSGADTRAANSGVPETDPLDVAMEPRKECGKSALPADAEVDLLDMANEPRSLQPTLGAPPSLLD